MTKVELVEEVRKVINEALQGRVEGIDPDDPLLRSGLISSLEIVVVASALEAHFKISIPDSAITVQSFGSLSSLAGLVAEFQGSGGEGTAGQGAAAEAYGWLLGNLSKSIRRGPFALVGLVLVCLVVIDLCVPLIVNGPLRGKYQAFTENGRRLYRVAWDQSQEDIDFAVSQHEITRWAADGRTRVAVFGDSGTIGSFVGPEETIPAYTESDLTQDGVPAKSFNLGFWLPSLTKDAMILDAVLERTQGEIPFDVAVFTISNSYVNEANQNNLIETIPYMSYNAALFDGYVQRLELDEADRALLQPVSRRLEKAGLKYWNRYQFWLGWTSLYHYSPFIRIVVLDRYVYQPLGKPVYGKAWRDYVKETARKPLFADVPPVPPADFGINDAPLDLSKVDERMVVMLDRTIDMFQAKGVKTVLYLRPIVPKEWERYFPDDGESSALKIATELCANSRCEIADMRYAISGTQFTDSLAHYTVEGNQIIARGVADAIERALKK